MRLIDADALMDKISSETIFIKDGLWVSKIIADAPTIEPSGDIISRADAVDVIDRIVAECDCPVPISIGINTVKAIIKSVPSVSADRPKGEWIDWLGKGNEWECSICKCSIESHGSIAYQYCPMCGAYMKGGAE